MNRRRRECKDNNAASVKRIMPEALCTRRRHQLHLSIINPIDTGHFAQKELDTTSDKSIIIFTYIIGLRTADWPTRTPSSERFDNRER
jgi:hypothetical protein